MKHILCDTSVLVSSLIEEQSDNDFSLLLLEQIRSKKLLGSISAHSIAECFATFSAIPRSPTISPGEARELIESLIRPLFQVIELREQDYYESLKRVETFALRSGAIFDSLILQAAIKKKIPVLVTWNLKHFQRFSNTGVEVIDPRSFLAK